MWPALLGGIGVFLLGMGLLADGLKDLAGDSLRRILQRFAGNRYTAAATGMVTTAFIQSSSATSLITIGLVGAGLVSLANGIAILIGANVGTSATSYLVAFVGLKFSVSAFALPLIGGGALGRLFLRDRRRAMASAVAGFGLLFLGIDLMRVAVQDFAVDLDIGAWAGGGWTGALVLVAVGVLMTILVQSSSAAMATTLAALSVGAIDLSQAAFLAIGQNIGTTGTAMLGAIGGSPAARRAALAHLGFNVGTALPALLFVVPLLDVVTRLARGDAVIALAFFHTAFNVLGVVLFLPLVAPMARALHRMVPEPRNPLVSPLDRAALETAAGAEAAVDRSLEAIIMEAVHLIRSRMSAAPPGRDWLRRLAACTHANASARTFLDEARRRGHVGSRIVDQVRTMDHISHILLDLRDPVELTHPDVRHRLAAFTTALAHALRDVRAPGTDAELKELRRVRKQLRGALLQRVVSDSEFGPEDARIALEALHRLDRIAWHLRRALQGLSSGRQAHAEPALS